MNSSANALAQAIPSLLAGYVAAHQARLTVLLGLLLVILAGIYFVVIIVNVILLLKIKSKKINLLLVY